MYGTKRTTSSISFIVWLEKSAMDTFNSSFLSNVLKHLYRTEKQKKIIVKFYQLYL